MRILHVSAQKPGRTGSGIFLQALLAEAAKTDHIQSVIVGISEHDPLCFSNDTAAFPVLFETADLPFPVVGMSDEMPYKSTRYQDLTDEMLSQWKAAFKTQIQTAVASFKPDIILAHHLWILSVFIKELYPEIPIFVITHGTGLRQMELASQFADYVRLNCRKLDLIFALSQHQKDLISQKYDLPADRIIVSGSGYNTEIFYPASRQFGRTVKIVYAGKLSKAKGIYSLLNAYAQLSCYDIELVMIGSASTEENISAMNYADKISLPVKFTGCLSQVELAEIFRQSDIFVLPSFFEGLPLVLIEALACGLRVVTNDLPGIRDFLGCTLCSEEIIEFVPLPPLEKVDQPHCQDLQHYETALRRAIEKHIKRTHDNPNIFNQEIAAILKQWTWRELFAKMNFYISDYLSKSSLISNRNGLF